MTYLALKYQKTKSYSENAMTKKISHNDCKLPQRTEKQVENNKS